MGIGIIIIGDEILSGKREDKHLSKFIQILAARGLQLDWAEYVGDQRDRIISTLQRSFASGDIVFSMMEWVLDTYYAHLFHQQARAEKAVIVYEAIESVLTPLMEQLEADFPQIKVFSLPSVGTATQRRHIELGVKGDPQQVESAFEKMCAGLAALHAEYVLISPT